MRTSTILTLASSVVGGQGLNLSKRRDGLPPKIVQHEIRRKSIENPLQHDRNRLNRRAGTINVDLQNEETLYYMDVSVGTPAQAMKLHIDTGSSDLWVNIPTSSLCSQDGQCDQSGTFTPSKSSTYKYVNSDFNITYVDGSGAEGVYATDVVKFGSVTLDNQQFGVGKVSTSKQGLIGIGYVANEAAIEYSSAGTYPNVPQSLVDNGYINNNAYSLWLNDLDASTGSILFGGVNTDKYTGKLETLPILPEDGVYAGFFITLTDIGVNGTSGSIAKNIAEPALLDSGSSLMYLPNSLTNDIYDLLGAQYNSQEGAAYVDCSLAESDMTLDFTFSSPTISVPLSELVLIAGGTNIDPLCIIGIAPIDSGSSVLGDTFIRSAYIVYDLQNNEISLAQTNFNSTSDNILEITNSTGVPDATTVQNPVTSVAAISGSVGNNEAPSSSSNFGAPTPAPIFNAAMWGAAGAALFAL